MLNDLMSAYGNRFLVAALGVSLALLCLFIVLWILRNRAPSPFVRGGRNRQPRLQVLDAAAIDTRRRIVLIRRDNVEHLVMIGGPTDLVIESGIGDERPYLSARPVTHQTEEEQSTLPSAAVQASLPADEQLAPMIASPAAAAAPTAVEAPVRRQPVTEAARNEPASLLARPATRPPAATAQTPTPIATARSTESVLEKAVPAVAVPMASAAAAEPIAAIVSTSKPVEPAPTVLTEAPTIVPTPRPVQPVEMSMADKPAMQPTAQLQPVISIEAETRPVPAETGVSGREPETLRKADVVEPLLPINTPPTEAVRMEPVEPVMRDRPQPAMAGDDRQMARAEPAPLLTPVIDSPAAEDVLEAARQRVLAPAVTPAPAVQPQLSPEPTMDLGPSSEAGETAARRDMSAFERVLEEEMALHLAADPAPVRPAPVAAPILPETRADRPRPPVAAVLTEGNRQASGQNPAQSAAEPNLQTEIARIFGEMSASRNP
jgi:flagellar biogenesis protein FliO